MLLISIIISAFNVLIIIFGEYLINYFKLEEKYPKFANLIKIRRKFVYFNIFISLSFIIILSLLFILADLYAFTV